MIKAEKDIAIDQMTRYEVCIKINIGGNLISFIYNSARLVDNTRGENFSISFRGISFWYFGFWSGMFHGSGRCSPSARGKNWSLKYFLGMSSISSSSPPLLVGKLSFWLDVSVFIYVCFVYHRSLASLAETSRGE